MSKKKIFSNRHAFLFKYDKNKFEILERLAKSEEISINSYLCRAVDDKIKKDLETHLNR